MNTMARPERDNRVNPLPWMRAMPGVQRYNREIVLGGGGEGIGPDALAIREVPEDAFTGGKSVSILSINVTIDLSGRTHCGRRGSDHL